MLRRVELFWGTGLLTSLACSVASIVVLRSFPPRELDVNMLFVPAPAMLKAGASGYDNLLADSLWLTLLQYYGERYFMTNRQFVNLDTSFNLITDLDPKFEFAYWLGCWALGDSDQTEAALALLRKGERENPDHIVYPYLQGFVHFLYQRDYMAAAQAFERASAMHVPQAGWDYDSQHRFTQTMTANMYRRQGDDRLALLVWQDLEKQADNKALKDIARRNIARIEAEMASKQAKPIAAPSSGVMP